MKYLLVVFISLVFFSCQNKTSELEHIENEINDTINESLKLNNESLMERIFQLYQKDIRLKKFKNGNNDYENFISIIEEVQLQGGFCIIDSSLEKETLDLRRKLDSLNFYDSEDLDFNFLYKIFNPIIARHDEYFKSKINEDLQNDLVYRIGIENLDTMNVSFTLYLWNIKENLDKEKLNRKYYFNTILLTTYGNFIFYSTEKKYCP